MISYFVGSALFSIGGLTAVFIKEKFKAVVFLSFAVLAELFLLPSVLQVLLYGGQIEAQLAFSGPIGISIIRFLLISNPLIH